MKFSVFLPLNIGISLCLSKVNISKTFHFQCVFLTHLTLNFTHFDFSFSWIPNFEWLRIISVEQYSTVQNSFFLTVFYFLFNLKSHSFSIVNLKFHIVMKSHVLLCTNHYLYVSKSKYKHQNKVLQRLTCEKLTLRFTHFLFRYKIRNINLMHSVLFLFCRSQAWSPFSGISTTYLGVSLTR